jgi:hypothetical protein
MADILEKLEKKLWTILTIRFKIELAQELEPGEMATFNLNEHNYLDDPVEEIIREIDDLVETYKFDICDMIKQDIENEMEE